MESYNLATDIMVFGFVVKTFPAGMEDALNISIQITGDCVCASSYYGLSGSKGCKIVYYTLAEEKSRGRPVDLITKNSSLKNKIINRSPFLTGRKKSIQSKMFFPQHYKILWSIIKARHSNVAKVTMD